MQAPERALWASSAQDFLEMNDAMFPTSRGPGDILAAGAAAAPDKWALIAAYSYPAPTAAPDAHALPSPSTQPQVAVVDSLLKLRKIWPDLQVRALHEQAGTRAAAGIDGRRPGLA